MDKWSADQRADIKKMCPERLALKLMKAGYDEEQIRTLDMQNLMEMKYICRSSGRPELER